MDIVNFVRIPGNRFTYILMVLTIYSTTDTSIEVYGEKHKLTLKILIYRR